MTVLTTFVIFNVFLDLNSFMQITHIEVLWVFHIKILENISPFEASERRLHLRLVSNNHPGLSILAVLEVFLEDCMLLKGHLFIAHWAHVVIETVIDISTVRVHQAILEGFPGTLRSMFLGYILRAPGLVEDLSLPLHAKVLAQLIEPTENRCVPREWPEAYLIERLSEAEDLKSLVLSQEGLASLCSLLAHVAKEVVEAGRKRGDTTRLLILRPTDAIPPVDVQIFPLESHLMPSNQLMGLQFYRYHLFCGHFLLFRSQG